jgi:hypothetical protein
MSRCLVALIVLVVLPAVAPAAVDCTAREPGLPHVCASGANAGNSCNVDFTGADTLVCSASRPSPNDCGSGVKCTMVFEKNATFSGVMLIMVDENVSQLDGNQSIQNAVALTVVFDLGKKGILSQTYQTLSGATLLADFQADLATAPTDSFGVQLSEQRLRDETQLRPDGKAAIVNDLLFRPDDTELAEALRTMFVTAGTPVILKVSSVTLQDHPDGLATVLRLKVKGGFVAP